MGKERPKQYLELRGRPVLAHAVLAFVREELFSRVVVVVPPGHLEASEELLRPHCPLEKVIFTEGMEERQASVYKGLQALPAALSSVCVHDGARPLISGALIREAVSQLKWWEAVTPALPLKETLKEVDEEGRVLQTLPRDSYRLIQTPQCFHRETLYRAHRRARKHGIKVTDDAALVEQMGVTVKTITGSSRNIKITTPEDLAMAEFLLLTGDNHV